jgi:hypothetical protein
VTRTASICYTLNKNIISKKDKISIKKETADKVKKRRTNPEPNKKILTFEWEKL